MQQKPPKIILRFLNWICLPELIKPLEGDLIELYRENLESSGRWTANLFFLKEAVLLIRRSIIRPVDGTYRMNYYGLLKNFLKTTFRYFKKNIKHTTINVLGLTLGLSSCFILFKHVEYFTLADQEHLHKRNIFEVEQTLVKDQMASPSKRRTFFGLGPYAKANYPEVDMISRFITTIESRVLFKDGDEIVKYNEPNIAEADPDFLRMFSFDFIHGDPLHALDNPETVIITESISRKYFGDENAMGKVLYTTAPWGTEYILTITGVIKDLPSNSTIKFDFLKSLYKKPNEKEEDWRFPGYRTFLYLKHPHNAQEVSIALGQDLSSLEALENEGSFLISLRSLATITLTTSQKLLLSVGILILLMTWINYANLFIAKSLSRAKEMAMRKISGSTSYHLFLQFVTESIVVHFIAFTAASVLVVLLYPYFQSTIQNELLPYYENHPILIASFVVFICLGVCITAIYPVFVFRKHEPLIILKSKTGLKTLGGLKFPVVIQFIISAIFITTAWIIMSQMQYMQDRNLGYETHHTLIISPSKDVWDDHKLERFQYFKNGIRQLADVQAVSSATSIPGRGGNGTFKSKLENGNDLHELTIMGVDVGFADALHLQLVAGSFYQPASFERNIQSAVINESAVRVFGFAENSEIIGQKIIHGRNRKGDYAEVIGVVRDYHFASLKKEISPLLLSFNPFRGHTLIALHSSTYNQFSNLQNAIDKIEKVWNEVYTDQVFDVQFLDQEFNNQYKDEILLRKLFALFTIVSILISSLGLIGLSMFITAERKSEVGIRKVLGASAWVILGLFSKNFMKQVALAVLISIPISYYLMNQWLQNFSYRTDMSAWFFIIPNLVLLLIAWITVLGEVFKSTKLDPAKVLRDE